MMALAAHIAELAEKHRLLERKIEAEVARPGSDDIEIHRLKLEKLKLKDEIVRLSGNENSPLDQHNRGKRGERSSLASSLAVSLEVVTCADASAGTVALISKDGLPKG